MTKVVRETETGILWKSGRKHSDLEYADDIVLNRIYCMSKDVQRDLDCFALEGKHVGLNVNCA